MKPKEYDRVRLLVEVYSRRLGRSLPVGTIGTVVDVPQDGEAEVYFVDVGEHPDFDNLSLTPDQFEVAPAE